MSDHSCVITTEYTMNCNTTKEQQHKHITFRNFKNFNQVKFLDDLRNCVAITNTEIDNTAILKKFYHVNTQGIELVHKLSRMNVRERLFFFQTLMIFKCIYGLAPDYLCNNVIMDIEVSKLEEGITL